jgi:hypothetical protein
LFSQLRAVHEALEDALRRRVNSLDTAGAEEAYGRLRLNLDRVVPSFLRGTAPLSHSEILAGIHSLRPSGQAENLERIFDRFLAYLRPMQATLEPAFTGFFRSLRHTLMLLNPLSLKDAVADIYDIIREKLHVLDPVALAASLRSAVFDPLMSALDGINPANLMARLDAVFQTAVQAVTTDVRAILDDIAGALQTQLQELKMAVQSVINQIDQAMTSATETFANMVEKLERLVFVEILGRLRKVIETLGVSFDRELDRVRNAFNEMLAAIPIGGGASASVAGG